MHWRRHRFKFNSMRGASLPEIYGALENLCGKGRSMSTLLSIL
jgi:hypothetical protein